MSLYTVEGRVNVTKADVSSLYSMVLYSLLALADRFQLFLIRWKSEYC